MAHDTHFLSRLERVRPGEVELALGLYRDPELVKALLSHSKTAQGAERVAIALGEGASGPWAVVASNGHFVTCLAVDMKHELPVISREQVTAVAGRVQKIREYTEEAKRLTGVAEETERAGALMRTLHARRDCLSREEFRAIASLEPVLGLDFLVRYVSTNAKLMGGAASLYQAERIGGQAARDYFDKHAELLWSLGPLVVLGTMAGPRRIDLIEEDGRRMFGERPVVTRVAHHRVATLWLQALWGAARLGKAVLPAYKRAFHEAESLIGWLDALFALTLLALRHGSLEAEVRKTLKRTPAGGTVAGVPFEAARTYVESVTRILDRRDEALADARRFGASRAVGVASDLPDGHPFAFRRDDDVPDDIAFPVVLASQLDPLGKDRTTLAAIILALPYLARAEAEELFLPKGFVDAVMTPFSADEMRALTEARKWKRPPLRKAAETGPNEPCPCGSGKKHKRCCQGKSAA